MKRVRPGIPDGVKIQVCERQFSASIVRAEGAPPPSIPDHLGLCQGFAAHHLGCEISELRYDHVPALRTRKYRPRKGRPVASWYSPNANDPEHIVVRSNHSHHIKTNVRGDGAQHPDRVLIKRERRREKLIRKVALSLALPAHVQRKNRPPKRKWPSRPFPTHRRRFQ